MPTPTEQPIHTDFIHSELLRAKVKQRRLHIGLSIGLLCSALLLVAMLVFSNATSIEVLPKEAKDSAKINVVNGVGVGLGFSIGNTVYTTQNNPEIEIRATGFQTLRKTLLGSETGHTLRIELTEQKQSLQITTTPQTDKTRWFMDNALISVAAVFKQHLLSEQYHIAIDNPYYQIKNISINMQLGQALQRHVQLENISGSLTIHSQPRANIQINGQSIGLAPITLQKSGGLYHLKITHADYQTIAEDIEITNNKLHITRDYRLLPKPAFLHITLSPANGVLLLNGKKINTAALAKLSIPAKTDNTLSYFKPGYFSQQQHINIPTGSEQHLAFHLKAATGIIHIRSKPTANVRIDGKSVGKTPVKLTLSTLKHRISLQQDGYRTYQQYITPSHQSARNISITLRTEQQVRLDAAPATIRNAAGIMLKRFNPNTSFLMGAPRYEQGQRANEFLRKVTLNRPFYISTHEISTGQFSKFKPKQGKPNHPVTAISWIEAAEFCNWLSKQEKLNPFYNIQHAQLTSFNNTANGYRLPTEAEWEWLARKAGKAQASKFPWGNSTTIPAKAGNIADEYAKGTTAHYVANYSDGYAGIAPIGSYPAESTGLFDVTGNVSEWVHDVYDLSPPTRQAGEINPMGMATGVQHTVKGSNWRSGTITELRASYRQGAKDGSDDIGFRVARYIN